MQWHISFYNQKVETETLTFPKGILANFLHIAEMIEECGPALGLPYTKSLGKGLFEIRAKSTEGIGRSFFCTIKDKEVVILHSFIKKSQKTPNKEMEIARKRLKEVKS
ncbi:type II toxin-antitoxin system RelE/ParE family toxin [methanotrophic endosymbiont of Bathymodiolus puteoserpentis (Logatchev)]|jgi:phage-related protein|uniref:type II toxin-antitoxin system RelE/ParE family toxin n=1 Tax=methanotrophic endosymbiont of Bathymodiolus puteoserpentis (Logatchev) TaxID=343235 RepID=UPI00157A4F82|nr:type II toxin-antitoxin system RelE/ParE family toxin [methanotrophic endosymbiont of Bathymodiolus puteoserpentis (Logatchev)]